MSVRIAVRYQSRGGNTRAVAQVIGEQLGVEALPVDTPLDERVDLLFLGGGVYKWDADKSLIGFLKNLDPQKVDQIAAFSTTGGMKKAISRIIELSDKSGIKVNAQSLCLKLMAQGHTGLGRSGGHLTDKQIEQVKTFAAMVVESA